MKFELERLIRPTRGEIVAEIRRVAELLLESPFTRKAFDKHARVSSSMLVRKFGGWEGVLRAAGLSRRYSGRTVSERMRSQTAKRLSDNNLVAELQRVAQALRTDTITMEQFSTHASVNAAAIVNRLGSWKVALERAGLRLSPLGRRYSDDDYFENVLRVWTSRGRQPKLREMDEPPSAIPSGAYEARFGGWKQTLAGFLARVSAPSPAGEASAGVVNRHEARAERNIEENSRARVRKIPLALRYTVLRRDRFRCVLCGASPVHDAACQLHVDHIIPFSMDGPTANTNLRTLCSKCNLGRGNDVESSI